MTGGGQVTLGGFITDLHVTGDAHLASPPQNLVSEPKATAEFEGSSTIETPSVLTLSFCLVNAESPQSDTKTASRNSHYVTDKHRTLGCCVAALPAAF